jgi:hypothetical protein
MIKHNLIPRKAHLSNRLARDSDPGIAEYSASAMKVVEGDARKAKATSKK